MTQIEFAEMLHIKRSSLSLLEIGLRRPSPKLAAKIEEVTGGAIPRGSWYWPEQVQG